MPVPALCTVHTSITPALHPRLTLLHQLHTCFTLCSHLQALHIHLTASFIPTFHLAFHLAPAHSTPTLRHLTPDLECCAAIVTCLTMAHWSCLMTADNISQLLTCSGINVTCVWPISTISLHCRRQGRGLGCRFPARGWQGSRGAGVSEDREDLHLVSD